MKETKKSFFFFVPLKHKILFSTRSFEKIKGELKEIKKYKKPKQGVYIYFKKLKKKEMDKSLLKRAMEDTEEPTPGYMFRDIAQWTFIDHATQMKLIGLLLEKLKPSSTSVHVLAKVLRIIKILCETGHVDFQKEMQRHSDDLKNFAAYRGGKQDPKYGDKLNEKVRTAAKEAIDAAFTHRRVETKFQVQAQGHGSDATFKEDKPTFTTGMVAPVVSTGDQRIAVMPTANKWAEHMAKGGAQSDVSFFVKDIKEAATTGFGLWRENVKTNEQRMNETLNDHGEFKPIEINNGFGISNNANNSAWKFSEEGPNGGGCDDADLPPISTAKILTPFQKEVERIAFLKNTPQRVELTQFLALCAEIGKANGNDFDELGPAMDEHLSQKYPWQNRLNVMSVLEHLLRNNLSPSLSAYFTENPEDVHRNIHVVQSSLKEKSQKVLKLLGVPERTVHNNTTTGGTMQAQQITTATSGGALIWAPASTTSNFGNMNSAESNNNNNAPSELDFGSMDVKVSGKKGGGKTTNSVAEKTNKLKKRAALVQQEDGGEEQQQQQKQLQNVVGWDTTANNNNNWKQGSNEPTRVAPDTTDGTKNANGNYNNSQSQPQRQSGGGFDDFDDFFKPSSTATSNLAPPTKQQQQPSFQQQQATFQQQQPSFQQQQPTFQQHQPLTQQPAPSAVTHQMLQQLQQQMEFLMKNLNMNDPTSLQQMNSLMAQQQQLMALMSQQQHVPHQNFDVGGPSVAPPPKSNNTNHRAFAAVQEEMMQKMRT